MSRTMVIWVDGHSQGANPQNGWHHSSYHKPKRLGICVALHLGAVVSVFVVLPCTLTLSSRLWKIKASPVTFPRAGSVIRGGAAAVPVNTYSPVSLVYT